MINKMSSLLRAIGPGLLFASTAIGTSHLILSTRAGAHHGMIFFWIILATLLLKYPFFEMAPRYVRATGQSLVHGYKQQGNWAVILFLGIIIAEMFVVTAAVGAVSAGLLLTLTKAKISIHLMLALILILTSAVLLLGRYRRLDQFIKIVSVLLLITVLIVFIMVLIRGPLDMSPSFQTESFLSGRGFVLLISLVGWMPVGMEASAIHSIWMVEKQQSEHHQPTLKESLFDFNLGYAFSALLAFLFLTIGAFTLYGSGQRLEGTPVAFCNTLLQVFSKHLGAWTYPVIAIAAFGTIYGTMITAMDAFSRSLVRSIQVFRFEKIEDNPAQQQFLDKYYNRTLVVIAVGAFLLFYTAGKGMIQFLELATIIAFVSAPIIAWLNWKLLRSGEVSQQFQPNKALKFLAYFGLAAMSIFSMYYIIQMLFKP
jgi:Mn2+/Fe2+ NRAMP family transporter